MALKDFRKVEGLGINRTVWIDKRNGDMVRAVHKGKLFFYDVRDKDRFIIFENDASSKADAISKAKSYMRSH